MPKSPKSKAAVLLACGLLVAGGLITLLLVRQNSASTELRTANRTFTLEVADTEAEQARGLSQRDSLAQDGGMVFPYSEERRLCFWMKDMRIPIDMIWLNGNKQVLHVEANVSPQTYPKDFCIDNAQYVIELNADAAATAGIRVGQQLKF